jgi:hypothetical protein
MTIENQISDDEGDSSALSIILLSASVLSFVISFMGIKWGWFRHRLTFEQSERQAEAPVILRTTSMTEFRENCSRGVYRQSLDSESLIISEKVSTLPPSGEGKQKIKTRKCHSIQSTVVLSQS